MQSDNSREVEAAELDRLLEEYLDSDMLQPLNSSTSVHSSSEKLARYFETLSSNESDMLEAEPILDRATKAATWHKALQDCNQSLASSQSDYSESPSYNSPCIKEESYSDSEIPRFREVIASGVGHSQSISQPSTPQPSTCDRLVKKALSFRNHKQQPRIKNSSRNSSAKHSTKMMQFDCRSFAADVWRRQTTTPVESFLGSPADDLVSYSTSPRLIQEEQNNMLYVEQYKQVHNLDHLSRSANDGTCFSQYDSSSSANPAIGASNGQRYNDNIDLAFDSCSTASGALSALLALPSSLPSTTKPWIPDTASALGFDLSASPELLDNTEAYSWWSSETNATHVSYPHMDNTPQYTSQNMPVQGLGITCRNNPFNFDTPIAWPVRSIASFNTTHPRHPRSHPSTGPTFSRPPSPNTPSRSHQRKPSPRSRPRHRGSHSQRRTSSSSSQRSSSRQTSNTGSGDVGFVNFTPDDSRKILTGVAPSGSSKTKARREREAAEKRRKLSQAAMKAVMDAGGDINSIRHLDRDGLLIM